MKAEHRKQLQTNVLADRMGRLVQTLKQRPRKRTILYIVLGVAVVGGVFIFFNIRNQNKKRESEKLVGLYNGHERFVAPLLNEVSNNKWTNAGRTAAFEYAYRLYLDNGVRKLGYDQPRAEDKEKDKDKDKDKGKDLAVEAAHVAVRNALEKLLKAKVWYEQLAEKCKDDPVWEPEARYFLAAIDEDFAILDRTYLAKALVKYKQVAEKFPDSAAGKRAEAKVELLENRASLEKVRAFYGDLAQEFGVKADRLRRDLKLDLAE